MPSAVDYSALARQVLDNSLRVKPTNKVWVRAWDHALDLAKAFASECSLRECPCSVSVRNEDAWLRSVLRSSKRQLGSIPPQEISALEETDFFVFTMGPRNPVPWNSIPKEKRQEVSLWLDTRYDKSSYARNWSEVARAHRVKMLGIEATLATPERAKAQGLRYREWRNVMLQGCLANPKVMARRAARLATLMSGRGSVRIKTRAGTQLVFDLDRRPVDISDGVSTEKMAEEGRVVFLPAGAIEVSVEEESADGKIVFSAPVRVGNERLENLSFDVKDGSIQHQNASGTPHAFERYLRNGGEESGRFSFFGIGLNPNLKHGFTQDDKVLGSVTIGFGSNTSIGGKNPARDQWWAAITRATVEIGGRTVITHGELLL